MLYVGLRMENGWKATKHIMMITETSMMMAEQGCTFLGLGLSLQALEVYVSIYFGLYYELESQIILLKYTVTKYYTKTELKYSKHTHKNIINKSRILHQPSLVSLHYTFINARQINPQEIQITKNPALELTLIPFLLINFQQMFIKSLTKIH